jgi:hypothetical protein
MVASFIGVESNNLEPLSVVIKRVGATLSELKQQGVLLFWIWGSQSGDYEKYDLLGENKV